MRPPVALPPTVHDHATHHDQHHVHGAPLSTDLGNVRRLVFVLVLVLLYTLAEIVGGIYTGSLALLADASHMASDVLALAVALTAIWLARRPRSQSSTFGFYRAEVLGALVNAVALIGIAGYIFNEAWHRFREPPEVLGGVMLAVASGGLLVNLTGVFVLHQGRERSLNLRGAWLHMLADTLGSVGAIASAVLIWRFRWFWADPVASVIIGVLVLWSSVALLRDTIRVLMEATPPRLDLGEVKQSLAEVDGVDSVHDLHAWTIGSGREALTAHVVTTETPGDDLLARLRFVLAEDFALTHVTLQLEGSDVDCEDCLFEGTLGNPGSRGS